MGSSTPGTALKLHASTNEVRGIGDGGRNESSTCTQRQMHDGRMKLCGDLRYSCLWQRAVGVFARQKYPTFEQVEGRHVDRDIWSNAHQCCWQSSIQSEQSISLDNLLHRMDNSSVSRMGSLDTQHASNEIQWVAHGTGRHARRCPRRQRLQESRLSSWRKLTDDRMAIDVETHELDRTERSDSCDVRPIPLPEAPDAFLVIHAHQCTEDTT